MTTTEPLDPRSDRRAYLARVADDLRLPPASTREIIEELEGHISDTVIALIGEGLTREAAEREALARLGSPTELARGIRNARQTPRRLLVAAGYGVWSTVTGAFWGYFFTAFLWMATATLAVIVLSLLNMVFGVTLWVPSGAPESVLIASVGLVVAALVGRRTAGVVATRSERRVADTHVAVALVGAIGIGAPSIFLVAVPQEPSTLVLLVGVPIAFGIGALTASESTASSIRHVASWAVAARLVVVMTLLLVVAHAARPLIWGPVPTNVIVEPPSAWTYAELPGDTVVSGDLSWSSSSAVVRTLWSHPAWPAGWTDYRLEAWPSNEAGQVAPSVDAPTIAVPFAPLGGDAPEAFQANVTLPERRERAWVVILATALDATGQRVVLVGPDGPVPYPAWTGTVWEYVTSQTIQPS